MQAQMLQTIVTMQQNP
jgi:hypothetical protein